MNINEYITKYLGTSNFILTKLNKGFTNNNYLLEYNSKRYVVRVPKENNCNLININHELVAEQLIHDCAFHIKLLHFNPNNGVKISEYLYNAIEYKDYENPNKLIMVAKLLKDFHSLGLKSTDDFNPIDTLNNYINNLKYPLYDLNPYLSIIDIIATYSYDKVLCHNDLVSGNLLFSSNHLYLIDFEYAANNDPLFDVMSFLSENQIYDSYSRTIFYNNYFDNFNYTIKVKLDNYDIFQHL
ncbi:MAG: choline/ethanolamine kinase family protein, partial [Erysipelotrichaceae bacterium]